MAKKKAPAITPYHALMRTIGQLFEHGREESRRTGNHAQTLACWDIGAKIIKAELNENGRAEYGDALIQKLSADLSKQYGRGFSERNLSYMITLAREYERNKLNTGLSYSQYCTLFAIPEPGLRRELERRAIREQLSYERLRRLIRVERGRMKDRSRPNGILNTFRITTRTMHNGKKEQYLDLGFGVYAEVPDKVPGKEHTIYTLETSGSRTTLSPARPGDLWLYKARIERIVDADTLIALIELPYGQHIRARLRLAGVEVPERGTAEEAKTTVLLSNKLKQTKGILIKTRGMDRYGRYVADVLYSEITNDPRRILKGGKHLNAELIRRERRNT